MNFFRAFDNIKTGIEKFDSSKFDRSFAIQMTMTNKDCGGIFYIEYKDGQLNIEPYNYYDHDVDVIASYSTMLKALSGGLDSTKAEADGKLAFSGTPAVFWDFASAISFKAPETASRTAKKPAAKCCKKPAAQKTPSPAEKKRTAKKAEVVASGAKSAEPKKEKK